LHLFPLHLLFGETYTISYLPSLQAAMKPSIPRNGNGHQQKPDLLNIQGNSEGLSTLRLEKNAIAQYFQHPESITPEEASSLTPSLQQGGNALHWTGHGEENPEHPSRSCFALKGKEKVTAQQLYSLELDYHLSTFSACEIAKVGDEGITSEFVGLGSVLLSSGVKYVISPLWSVREDASTLIMIEFYRQLQAEGKSPAEALAEANHWLRHLTVTELQAYLETVKEKIAPQLSKRQKLDLNQLVQHIVKQSNGVEKREETSHAISLHSTDKPFDHPYFYAAFVCQGFAV
jgi:CHAT domain-containing protein